MKTISKESKYPLTDSDDKSFKIPIKIKKVNKEKYVSRYLDYVSKPSDMFFHFDGFHKMNQTDSSKHTTYYRRLVLL